MSNLKEMHKGQCESNTHSTQYTKSRTLGAIFRTNIKGSLRALDNARHLYDMFRDLHQLALQVPKMLEKLFISKIFKC